MARLHKTEQLITDYGRGLGEKEEKAVGRGREIPLIMMKRGRRKATEEGRKRPVAVAISGPRKPLASLPSPERPL